MNINWYPGHMAKTRRELAEAVKGVDLVCELTDARIPCCSRNPVLDEIAQAKPRLIILNRRDQADERATARWRAHFAERGIQTLECDSRSGAGCGELSGMARRICADTLAGYAGKGQVGRGLRVMVVGIPNVGKSSFINRVSGRRAAKAEDRPGVTRRGQWIRVGTELDLLDTPGMLWPRLDNARVALRLALTGAVKDEILDRETLGLRLFEELSRIAPEALAERYGISVPAEPDALELMEAAARKRGFLLRGGELDYERTARTALDEFRSGALGRITLDFPGEDI